ncbi:MAG: LysR family transcriptional regulator [Nocardioidaceae bacterium]
MELRDIETFLVLADELHFAKTAERLYLSPSRVTQTIQRLEREVGGPLFERTSRQVSLTALGERFREAAQIGFDQLQTALRDAQAAARGVELVLRLGYQYSIGPELALELAAAFETKHPGSGVVVTTLNEVFDFTSIRNGHVDVLLTWSPGGPAHAALADDLTAGPVLGSDQRAVLVAKDHPLATRESITTDDLIGYDIRKPDPLGTPAFADAWAPRQTTSGNPIHQVDGGRQFLSALDLLTTVARSQMAHFTIQSILDRYPHQGVVAVPITDLPPCVIVPVWRTSAENATIRALADLASQRQPA